ncbi:MAG: bifunctional 2-C-methyl-D-erythritol 4-phosphate cytidylyltransferase/2-C-methyl-D-erythritol 2,4-cyclodiphosphate synthase, partial [Alphaproteobacteria bacterium]
MSSQRVAVLVVAAGRGSRAGGGLPKQYRPVHGRPVLGYSLEAFARHPLVDMIRVVIHPDDRDLYDEAAGTLDLLEPVPGGETRQESVYLGLASLKEDAPDVVLIHDGARPVVEPGLIARVIEGCAHHPGAIAAMPVTDTLKRAQADSGNMPIIERTVSREGLWRAQTPQGFRYQDILSAHGQARGHQYTDDAAVAEAAGLTVGLVEGARDNLKITLPGDFDTASELIREHGHVMQMETRLGTGFDVHKFGPGDRVILCGVPVPHDHGLTGHSDADAGLHALTDALLGALGAGDIGQHFPPTDEKWKGVSSDQFLRHAVSLIEGRGGRVVHLDVTLICERPKVGPHREAMVKRIAEIAGVPASRVNVKATTTEQLGFTGRREGIAAQAAATIALPVE